MDKGSGIDQIQAKFFDSLHELKQKESRLAEIEARLQMGQQVLDADRDRLMEETRKVAEREEELAKEKNSMTEFPVDESDIVELNVQGTIILTHRSTLIQFQDSYLAGLFNGRWESKIRRDKEGRVFFDFIPTTFRQLLDYLTELKLSTVPVPIPRISKSQSAEFRVLLQHLGLEEAIYGSPGCLSRTLKSNTIVLGEDGMSATSASDVMGFVLGEEIFKNEAVEFSLAVHTLQQPWIFLGIMEDSNMHIKDNSFNGNPGAYGWAGLGGVWAAGEKLFGAPILPENALTSGLWVKLLLECRDEHDSYLTLTVESDSSVHKIEPLPTGKRWRLHLNMVGLDDSIELLKVRKITS